MNGFIIDTEGVSLIMGYYNRFRKVEKLRGFQRSIDFPVHIILIQLIAYLNLGTKKNKHASEKKERYSMI